VQELGGSTARQTAKLARGNNPYHRCHAQFMKGGLAGGQEYSFARSFNHFYFSGSSDFFEFGLFFGSSVKFVSSMFYACCLGTGYTIGHWVVREKNYSVFCLFVIIFSFVLLHCLFSTHDFCFLSISPPSPPGGEREGGASGCQVLVASCGVKLQQEHKGTTSKQGDPKLGTGKKGKPCPGPSQGCPGRPSATLSRSETQKHRSMPEHLLD